MIDSVPGFWLHVHALLDARQDPNDDESVQDFLLEHPELLAEFAELTGTIRCLATGAPPARRRWTRLRIAAIVGVVLTVVGVAFIGVHWFMTQGAPTQPEDLELAVPVRDVDAVVQRFEMRRYHESGFTSVEHVVGSGAITETSSLVCRQRWPAVLTAAGHSFESSLTRVRHALRQEWGGVEQ